MESNQYPFEFVLGASSLILSKNQPQKNNSNCSFFFSHTSILCFSNEFDRYLTKSELCMPWLELLLTIISFKNKFMHKTAYLHHLCLQSYFLHSNYKVYSLYAWCLFTLSKFFLCLREWNEVIKAVQINDPFKGIHDMTISILSEVWRCQYVETFFSRDLSGFLFDLGMFIKILWT